jgi:predicted dehydrogenase
MYQIAVIGAGQLGSRHLQGLAGLRESAHLHVVDPAEVVRGQAKSRLVEAAGEESARQLTLHQDASTLPSAIDFAVVATTANHRFAALDALLNATKVRYLLLEKVLFQRFSEYEQAGRLIERHGVRTWVNCPRRAYEVYRTVKGWFAADPVVHMDVAGGAWGLGCNGVHFVDLFAFLTETVPNHYDSSDLDPDSIPARRTGFIEYTGTLRARSSAASLAIASMRDSQVRHLITIRSRDQQAVIDEGSGTAWRLQSVSKSQIVNFSVPWQSQMTGIIAWKLLDQGDCELTPYAQSAAIHLGFLRALAGSGGESAAAACRVT